MNRKSAIALLILVLALCYAVPVTAQPGGDGPLVFRARLNGYQEVPPQSTEGRGRFRRLSTVTLPRSTMSWNTMAWALSRRLTSISASAGSMLQSSRFSAAVEQHRHVPLPGAGQ